MPAVQTPMNSPAGAESDPGAQNAQLGELKVDGQSNTFQELGTVVGGVAGACASGGVAAGLGGKMLGWAGKQLDGVFELPEAEREEKAFKNKVDKEKEKGNKQRQWQKTQNDIQIKEWTERTKEADKVRQAHNTYLTAEAKSKAKHETSKLEAQLVEQDSKVKNESRRSEKAVEHAEAVLQQRADRDDVFLLAAEAEINTTKAKQKAEFKQVDARRQFRITQSAKEAQEAQSENTIVANQVSGSKALQQVSQQREKQEFDLQKSGDQHVVQMQKNEYVQRRTHAKSVQSNIKQQMEAELEERWVEKKTEHEFKVTDVKVKSRHLEDQK